ncbi:hypothetical protein CVIRNUC_007406 [Coccomyxa viridis]|uniref:F-box domain-containing protein n=1 Tax=Coccomyxa viridis TaxID=1274662 RepID=A0AAV1IAT7_9CHLO|nr:hypothetical protein CVIRNUC_007406 [Coccomyxa viridis]
MPTEIRPTCDGVEQTRIDQPQLPEDVWQNISNYLSIEEWAKAAGTCKMTCRMPLKWIRLGRRTPLAGWEFALQRCTGVVGMDIDIEGDTGGASQAKELMDGVARQIKSGAFTSMKELRIGWRFWIGCDAQITSHMALANTAAACHSLKVLVLSCDRLGVLPAFRAVKHLVVEQPDMQAVSDGLYGLPVLQTLSLINSDKSDAYRCRQGWELALGRHMNLQHLHLQNLVPQSLTIRGACRVHALYTGRFGIRETVAREDRATWAGSYLWNNVGPQLSSVSVQDDYSTLRPFGSQEAALMEMLSVNRELEYVSLTFCQIGTSHEPLFVSPSDSMGLVRARTLRLRSTNMCHVQVERGAPLAWLDFSIQSGGDASLNLDGCLDFVRGLQNFEIACRAFCGPGCVDLAQALAPLGRSIQNYRSCCRWSLNSFEHGHVPKEFRQLMLCGCCACISCLQAGGKLVRGSLLSREGQPAA